MILLSVRPCCTDDVCTGEVSPSQKEHLNKKGAGKDECRTCSPFYSCGNCAGFTSLTQIIQIVAIPAVSQIAAYTVYQQPSLKDVSRAIWQPPQWS
ncbi:MAG: hypothetical protein EOP51_32150 [Sphingobacteriales bacterium]|nr:MAG: hypothetical protein EOP51_32150 [Sphingobacteriales bacterium]